MYPRLGADTGLLPQAPGLTLDAAPLRAALEAALAASQAAPLSARKALLVLLLVDAEIDRRFAVSGEDDVLAFRAGLGADAPALGAAMAVAAQRPDGPRLVVEAVKVPLEAYGELAVEDFMISLYNGHTVQRLLLAWPDGRRRDAREVLAEAMAALGQ